MSTENRNIGDPLKKQSNLHYTRGIMPKGVTSGEVQLRGIAPGQYSSEKRRRAGEALATVSDLTDLNRTPDSRANSSVFKPLR